MYEYSHTVAYPLLFAPQNLRLNDRSSRYVDAVTDAWRAAEVNFLDHLQAAGSTACLYRSVPKVLRAHRNDGMLDLRIVRLWPMISYGSIALPSPLNVLPGFASPS